MVKVSCIAPSQWEVGAKRCAAKLEAVTRLLQTLQENLATHSMPSSGMGPATASDVC